MNLDFACRSDPLENAKAAKEISRIDDRAVFEMPAPTPLIGPDDSVSGLICTATGAFSTFQD
jgi:hypothetical protein